MTVVITKCAVCDKRTKAECAHTACPNRKPVTARQPDERVLVYGGHGCSWRKPIYSPEEK